MDQRKLAEIRRRLLALREEMTGKLAGLRRESLSRTPREQSGDLSGYSIHLADAATDSHARDVGISLASRGRQKLNDVHAAIAKLGTEEFGVCEICSHPIDETRLAAMPYARFCLACKERLEGPRSPA